MEISCKLVFSSKSIVDSEKLKKLVLASLSEANVLRIQKIWQKKFVKMCGFTKFAKLFSLQTFVLKFKCAIVHALLCVP